MNGEQADKLSVELTKHTGKTVFLGTRSSFFYVGPCEEALSGLVLIDRMERAYAALVGGRMGFAKSAPPGSAAQKRIGDRLVVKTYKRESSADNEVVIIVEGREFGAFWTRREYVAGRKAFRRALDMATSTKARA